MSGHWELRLSLARHGLRADLVLEVEASPEVPMNPERETEVW